MDLYQKVKAYVGKWQMLEKDDVVIAGVSGGADSVCLLFMLLELKKEIGFSLLAVHVNHGIRGGAADRDEAYVRELCRKWETDLKVYHQDVPSYAKRHKLTEEEAGREVRRKCFQETLEEAGGTRIALAHHENDNAETLIFHLCRGTGLKGLGGMEPVNGKWIRPLLCLERKEIACYLRIRGIPYCVDETNEDNRYTRNYIRREIISGLEAHVNTESVRHMAEAMEKLRSLAGYVERETENYERRCVKWQEKKYVLYKDEYEKVPEELREYVLHRMLCMAAGKKKDVEYVHIRILEELLKRQTGRSADLPYGLKARRCYEGIVLYREGDKADLPEEEAGEVEFQMRIFENTAKEITFPQNPYTKWFDYDIIKNTVKIRHRQPGDYITINSSGGTKKLKQYFTDEKIPQEKRDSIWLAADGNHILWVVGYRQNQAYQITEHTKRILEIACYGGEEDGRDN